jgi:hypothetical protein
VNPAGKLYFKVTKKSKFNLIKITSDQNEIYFSFTIFGGMFSAVIVICRVCGAGCSTNSTNLIHNCQRNIFLIKIKFLSKSLSENN